VFHSVPRVRAGKWNALPGVGWWLYVVVTGLLCLWFAKWIVKAGFLSFWVYSVNPNVTMIIK